MELCYRNNPRSLFRKYARLVTAFTQHQLGRDYLGIKDKNIAFLLPNGYHQLNRGIARAKITTRAVYSKNLTPALQRLDAISNYITDFDGALKTFFYQAGLIRNPHLVPDVVLDTFSPDADPESTTVDGFVNRQGVDEVWSTIRGGAGSLANDSTSDSAPQIGSSSTSSQWAAIGRVAYLFDISSIGASNVIDSGTNTLDIYSNGGKLDSFTQTLQITTSSPASNTALATGDFALANWGSTSLGAETVANWSGTQDVKNTITINSSGDSQIEADFGGITKLGLRMSGDVSDTEPSWSGSTQSRVYNQYADDTNPPVLTITYTAPGGGFFFINT